jgi:hypothetical protein
MDICLQIWGFPWSASGFALKHGVFWFEFPCSVNNSFQFDEGMVLSRDIRERFNTIAWMTGNDCF